MIGKDWIESPRRHDGLIAQAKAATRDDDFEQLASLADIELEDGQLTDAQCLDLASVVFANSAYERRAYNGHGMTDFMTQRNDEAVRRAHFDFCERFVRNGIPKGDNPPYRQNPLSISTSVPVPAFHVHGN